MERIYRLMDKYERSLVTECGYEENVARTDRIMGRLLKAIRDAMTDWNKKGLAGDEMLWEKVPKAER